MTVKEQMTAFIIERIKNDRAGIDLTLELIKYSHRYPKIASPQEWERRIHQMIENGEIVQHSDGSFSIPSKHEQTHNFNVSSENVVFGDNYGNQSSSKTTYNAAHTETNIAIKIAIGLIITIVGGIAVWIIIELLSK